MNVAVLGASRKPERYSYRAVKALLKNGHAPFPVHPGIEDIDGLPVFRRLDEVPAAIDTITVYVSARRSDGMADSIVESGARRVIFNPGAENPELALRLAAQGVDVVEACTLVLLATGQF